MARSGPHGAGFSARISLLDGQIVDRDELPIGRVDDVELDPAPDGLEVVAILTGSQALGERLGGGAGRLMAGASAQLRSGAGPTRIEPALVAEIEPLIKLSRSLAELEGVAPLERWLSRRFIGRLPGAGDAVE